MCKWGWMILVLATASFQGQLANGEDIFIFIQGGKLNINNVQGFNHIWGNEYLPDSLRRTVDNYQTAVFVKYVEDIRPGDGNPHLRTRFAVIRPLTGQELPETLQKEVVVTGFNQEWVEKTSLLLIGNKTARHPQFPDSPNLEFNGIVQDDDVIGIDDARAIAAEVAEEQVPAAENVSVDFVRTDASDAGIIDYHIIPMSEACLKYIEGMPKEENPPQRQLIHAAKFLDSKDERVAADALSLIQQAPCETLLTISSHIPVEAVRKLYLDRETPPELRNYALLLLGINGDANDFATVAECFPDVMHELNNSLHKAMIGVLLLDKSAGLEFVERELLNRKEDPDFGAATFQALEFFGDRLPEWLDHQSVRGLVEKSLTEPTTARSALEYLRSQRDWSYADLVMSVYRSNPAELPQDQRVNAETLNGAVIRYLLACSELFDENATEATPVMVAARNKLDELRETDGLFVKQIEEQSRREHVFQRDDVHFWAAQPGAVDFVIEGAQVFDLNFDVAPIIEVGPVIGVEQEVP